MTTIMNALVFLLHRLEKENHLKEKGGDSIGISV